MAKQPGPSLWLSLTVGLLGFVLSSGGAIFLAARVYVPDTGEPFAVPGSETRVLEPGDHDIFGLTGPLGDLEAEPTFGYGDLTVTRVETGTEIAVQPPDPLAHDLRDGMSYDGVGLFTVEEPGNYRIDVNTGVGSRALVERSSTADWGELVAPFAIVGLGALLSAAGTLMLIIGIVRRRAHPRS